MTEDEIAALFDRVAHELYPESPLRLVVVIRSESALELHIAKARERKNRSERRRRLWRDA